jgi:very-short-patch-repair endonuclease
VQAALDQGVSTGRLRGTDLQRPYHGVRVDGARILGLAERARAYQTRMPDHAVCGSTAALLYSVPLPLRLQAARIHVVVPLPTRAPKGRSIVGHAVTAADLDLVVRDGILMTSPERTWFDLGAILGLPDLVAASDFLIRRDSPLTSRGQLREAFHRYSGRRGRRALSRSLKLMNERSESPAESRTRVILLDAQLPDLSANLEIITSGGHHYRADLAFSRERVLLEYQSDYHGDIGQFRADMTRRSRLEADGWYVLFINADDLNDPEELVERIRKVLRSRTP